MSKAQTSGNTDKLTQLGTDCPESVANKLPKLRPRRPIRFNLDDLPDAALVEKGIRSAITGLGDSQTYELIKQGRFPTQVRLGPRCSRWRMGDLRRWLSDPLNYRTGVPSISDNSAPPAKKSAGKP